jgi:hypothetical protein
VLAPAHLPLSPALRALAAAAALELPDGATLALRTAAWVHAGGDAPQALDRGRRSLLRPADVAVLGGVRVTTPPRTAVDLARELPPHQALPWLDRLRDDAGLDPADVVRRLEAIPVPARRLVRAWAG